MKTRLLALAAPAATLVLLFAAPGVLAGGWATIVADDASPPEPRVGEEVEYGFTVLQHGVTPVNFDEPTLRLANVLTGETLDVPADPSGPDGHYVARVTFKQAGQWTWAVTLERLAVKTSPVGATVFEVDGSSPRINVADALGAIDRAKTGVAADLGAEFGKRIAGLEAQVAVLDAERAELRGQLDALEASAANAAGAAAGSGDGGGAIPPIGVVTLALLSGSIAGFAMTWLGRRNDPAEIEPRGVGQPAATG
jgi:hypothetical protein